MFGFLSTCRLIILLILIKIMRWSILFCGFILYSMNAEWVSSHLIQFILRIYPLWCECDQNYDRFYFIFFFFFVLVSTFVEPSQLCSDWCDTFHNCYSNKIPKAIKRFDRIMNAIENVMFLFRYDWREYMQISYYKQIFMIHDLYQSEFRMIQLLFGKCNIFPLWKSINK